MNRYRRLTPKDRCQIELLKERNFGVREISRILRVSPSTISRELKKCLLGYSAEEAGEESVLRARGRVIPRYKISGHREEFIKQKLLVDWSPEQICGWLKRENKSTVSIQTIYRYIERDKLQGGKLKSHLRILRLKRKDRKRPKWRVFRGVVTNRKLLAERPKIVEKRERLGDFERDTVFGKHNGPFLLTIVDRKSRYVRIAWVPRKSAELVHRATVRLLKKEIVNTITNDNGVEFAFHRKTSKALDVPIYFSRAYAAWERGTNENTNGLIRQYLPRKKDIGVLTLKQVRALERKLNMRPRKCLGYRCPNEIEKS